MANPRLFTARTLATLTCWGALATVVGAQPAAPPKFKAPSYDLRVVLDGDFLQNVLAYAAGSPDYGDILRVGELGCGDPSLSLALTEGPRLRFDGSLNTATGTYRTDFGLHFGLRGDLGTECLGIKQVSATTNVRAGLGRISQMDTLDLSGTAYLNTWGSNPLVVISTIFGYPVPIQQKLDVPFRALSEIPVELSSEGTTVLDFGRLCAKHCSGWISEGSRKTIPLNLNVGSFGKSNFEGDRYVAVDVTFGATPAPPVEFNSPFFAAKEFARDVPIWKHETNGDMARNFGFSVRDTAFAEVKACYAGTDMFGTPVTCDPGRGLLAQLLPVRAKGRIPITPALAVDYVVILDSASVARVGSDGSTKFVATIRSSSAGVRIVNPSNGNVIATVNPKNVGATMTISQPKWLDGGLLFPIDELYLTMGLEYIGVPAVIKSPNLARHVNNGRIVVPVGTESSVVEMPPCLELGPKFKSRNFACGFPGKRVGFLSRSDHLTTVLSVQDASFDVRSDPWLQVTGGLVFGRGPNVPAEVAKAFAQGQPFLATRWRASDTSGQGEAQCGVTGGDQYTPLGEWTPAIRMDTDQRPGRCDLSWSILDPKDLLKGVGFDVRWTPSGDYNQCKGRQGVRRVPTTTDLGAFEEPPFSDALGIDTDDASGGCYETFELVPGARMELDVKFGGDDDPSQCGLPSPVPASGFWTVAPGQSLRFLIDTDRRYGGCVQQLRLRPIS